MTMIRNAIAAAFGAVLLGGTALAEEPVKLGEDQLDRVTAGFLLDLRLALSETFGNAGGQGDSDSSSSTEASDIQNTELEQDTNGLSLKITDELATSGQSSAANTGPNSVAETGSASAAGKLFLEILGNTDTGSGTF